MDVWCFPERKVGQHRTVMTDGRGDNREGADVTVATEGRCRLVGDAIVDRPRET